ncbi:hypothetical protein T11_16871 [Trichinella zimbabwensis]|uniref:Uncharacterized protein n=1 Tax=Trichinella zimbabwensis TaxID=268475 RepID=A0A0V1GKZ6_9BILA|nr:hypothetical protein T11_16871 [Trichinella zimbabwensis]
MNVSSPLLVAYFPRYLNYGPTTKNLSAPFLAAYFFRY